MKTVMRVWMQSQFCFWKTVRSTPQFLNIGTVILLFSILSLGFWIRIKDVPDLPDQQFTSNDAYLYYSQARTITEQGYLPDHDMDRWLPNGRDNRQLLPLYSYALAYMHKAITLFFHKVTLYQVQLYAPTVCFTLGLALLLFFLTVNYGLLLASIVGVLLVTFPSSIARSAAGFSDRDAWCWMLAIIAIITYLWKEKMQPGRHRYLTTALCGFIVFLGGLSWEAFGIFVLILLSAEIWKFCTTEVEENLKEYILWVLMFVPWLYLISPAYRSGYGFSTYVGPLMLAPSVALLILKIIRYLLLRFVKQLRPHARKIAWGLTLFGIAAGGIYVILKYNTFAVTAFPFQESRLMKSVTELSDPDFTYWISSYGSMFILGSISLVTVPYYFWKWNALTFIFGLFFLSVTIFLHYPLYRWIGPLWCDLIFIAAFPLTVIGIGIASTRKHGIHQNELPLIITLVWFLIWVSFTRNGLRYGFFMGPPIALGTAVLLKHIATFRDANQTPIQLFGQGLHPKMVTLGFITIMLILLLFWPPAGGYLTGTQKNSVSRNAIPGQGTLKQAFNWIKSKLPYNSTVVAAHWGYGSQLNVHGNVKTITDQDHFIPHWYISTSAMCSVHNLKQKHYIFSKHIMQHIL